MAGRLAPLAVLLSAPPPRATADNFDLVEARKLPPPSCPHGCARWAQLRADGACSDCQPWVDALWSAGSPPPSVGALCANPARAECPEEAKHHAPHALEPHCSDIVRQGWQGSWCFCKNATTPGTPARGYCVSPPSTPEQINLQMAASDVVVVAFVTAEKDPLSITAPPRAELSGPASAAPAVLRAEGRAAKIEVSGVTHHYQVNNSYPDVHGTCPGHTPAPEHPADVPSPVGCLNATRNISSERSNGLLGL